MSERLRVVLDNLHDNIENVEKDGYLCYWNEKIPTLYKISPLECTYENYNSDNSIFYPWDEDELKRSKNVKILGWIKTDDVSVKTSFGNYILLVENQTNFYKSWCHCSYTIVEAFNLCEDYAPKDYEPIPLMYVKEDKYANSKSD